MISGWGWLTALSAADQPESLILAQPSPDFTSRQPVRWNRQLACRTGRLAGDWRADVGL